MTNLRNFSSTDAGTDVLDTLNRRGAKRGLRELIDGVRSGVSCVVNLLSDSTGVQDQDTRWPFVLMTDGITPALADIGNARVEFHQMRGASEPTSFSLLKPIVLKEGAGPQGMQFRQLTGNMVARGRSIAAGDFATRAADDLCLDFGFDPDFASPAADGTFWCVQGSGVGNRAWALSQTAAGAMRLTWFTEPVSGADTTEWAEWSAATAGYAPGTPMRYRVVLDVDNGSGGFTAQLFAMPMASYYASGVTQPPAQAWGTAKAPTATSRAATSGVTSVAKATGTAPMSLGSRPGNTSPWFGKIYAPMAYDGVDGGFISSPDIQTFGLSAGGAGDANSVLIGSPTFYWFNAASAGKDFAWFAGTGAPADAMRPNRIHTRNADLTIISTGHNEAFRLGNVLKASIDTFVANVASRSPLGGIHFIIQNPELPANSTGVDTAALANTHAVRQRQMADYANRLGFTTSDVFSAFMADPRGLAALINPANPPVHPQIPAGYRLQAQVIGADFGVVVP